MRRYAIRRSLTVIPVLVGVSILVFGFVHLIPGDPAVTMLGERATPEKVAEVRARLGLIARSTSNTYSMSVRLFEAI